MQRVFYKRKTQETQVEVALNFESGGPVSVDTGIPFFDHMLSAWFKYAKCSGHLLAKGDLEVDDHHTIEDVGIALGKAVNRCTEGAIKRFGTSYMPMDEALVRVVGDFGGRAYLAFEGHDVLVQNHMTMTKEFLRAFAMNAQVTLHIDVIRGENAHHVNEAIYKALGMVSGQCLKPLLGDVFSTKGQVRETYDRDTEL